MVVAEKIQADKSEWLPATDNPSSLDDFNNRVVDAYKKRKKDGYVDGVNDIMDKMFQGFSSKLHNAMKLSSDLYLEFSSDRTDLAGMYLKIVSLSEFKAIVILPTPMFYSKQRRELTEKMIDLSLSTAKNDFRITFSSIPNKEELNIDSLISDGYVFQYDNKRASAKA